MAGRVTRRVAFACVYLAGYLLAELVYILLTPHAQTALIAWASTNVANLEHEPIGPLILSAFVGPGYYVVWPVLIALAVFGANRALGTARTVLICVAGHVIGTCVSEGIIAYRIGAGQLPAADRYLTDVGPSYVVVSAIVIALACGTALAHGGSAGLRRARLRRAYLQRPEPRRRLGCRPSHRPAHRGGGRRLDSGRTGQGGTRQDCITPAVR